MLYVTAAIIVVALCWCAGDEITQWQIAMWQDYKVLGER
jgi:hypothetical protein